MQAYLHVAVRSGSFLPVQLFSISLYPTTLSMDNEGRNQAGHGLMCKVNNKNNNNTETFVTRLKYAHYLVGDNNFSSRVRQLSLRKHAYSNI